MPKVFLCHSSQDKDFVRRLADDLNAMGLQYWFDEKEILVGDPIRQKIEEGLKESDFLAIVLSPDSVASPWVARELDAKIIEEMQSKKVSILPLYYKDCVMPAFLVSKHYADFRSDYDKGLRDLVARFEKSKLEDETKRKILIKIANSNTTKIDPHLVLQLAFNSGAIEDAAKLAEIHQNAHPGCALVLMVQAASATLQFKKQRTTPNFLNAVVKNWEFGVKNPSLQNANNIAALLSGVPKDLSIESKINGMLNETVNNFPRTEAFCAISAHLIDILHRLPLVPDARLELVKLALRIIRDSPSAAIRASFSHLVHIITHACDELPKQTEVDSILSDLHELAKSRVENSAEFADAFLHLAWSAAKRHKRKEAKVWLEKYQLTVPTAKYIEELRKHPPLETLS